MTCVQTPEKQGDEEVMKKIPYQSAVGSLTYEMVYIKLDIVHIVSVISYFANNSGLQNWAVVTRIFRYVRGSWVSVYHLMGEEETAHYIFFKRISRVCGSLSCDRDFMGCNFQFKQEERNISCVSLGT
jgi:hypothetical protein